MSLIMGDYVAVLPLPDSLMEKRTIPLSIAPQDDWRNQFQPDGKHNQTREWIEGDQRVVERNMGGPGEDVRFSFAFFLFLVSTDCSM